MVNVVLVCSFYIPFILSFRYSTGSNLNTYSALIQNFYSQETAPNQAIHVAVNTGVEEGQEPGVKAFIRLVLQMIHDYNSLKRVSTAHQ